MKPGAARGLATQGHVSMHPPVNVEPRGSSVQLLLRDTFSSYFFWKVVPRGRSGSGYSGTCFHAHPENGEPSGSTVQLLLRDTFSSYFIWKRCTRGPLGKWLLRDMFSCSSQKTLNPGAARCSCYFGTRFHFNILGTLTLGAARGVVTQGYVSRQLSENIEPRGSSVQLLIRDTF